MIGSEQVDWAENYKFLRMRVSISVWLLRYYAVQEMTPYLSVLGHDGHTRQSPILDPRPIQDMMIHNSPEVRLRISKWLHIGKAGNATHLNCICSVLQSWRSVDVVDCFLFLDTLGTSSWWVAIYDLDVCGTYSNSTLAKIVVSTLENLLLDVDINLNSTVVLRARHSMYIQVHIKYQERELSRIDQRLRAQKTSSTEEENNEMPLINDQKYPEIGSDWGTPNGVPQDQKKRNKKMKKSYVIVQHVSILISAFIQVQDPRIQNRPKYSK